MTSITLEKIARTPFEPGGTRAAASSMTTYGSTPRRAASAALELAERVAEPAHRDPAVEADPLGHPLAGHRVAERPDPGLRVDERLVGDRRSAARSCRPTSVSRSGRTTPMPTSPSWVSAPPTTTGVPAASPVSSAAPAAQRPDDRARLEDLGHDRRGSSPTRSSSSGDQVRRAQVEQVGAGARRRVGDEPPGQPIEDPVAEHARRGRSPRTPRAACVADPAEPGRRGDRDPVAAGLEDPSRVAAPDELVGLRARRASRRSGRPRSRGPPASYRTIPSRMLVLLTAAMSAAVAPDRCDRLADAVADQPPVAGRVEDLRAGHAGQGRVATTRAGPIATWRPSSSKSTARQLPVPRSMASRWRIRRPIPVRRAASAVAVGDVDERLAGDAALDLGDRHLARRGGASRRSPRRCGSR